MGMILFSKATSFQSDYKTIKTLIPFSLSDSDFFDSIQEPMYNLTSKDKERKSEVFNRIKTAMIQKGYDKDSFSVNFWSMSISVDSPLESA